MTNALRSGTQLEDAREVGAELGRDHAARLVEQLLARDLRERELADPGDRLLLRESHSQLCARHNFAAEPRAGSRQCVP